LFLFLCFSLFFFLLLFSWGRQVRRIGVQGWYNRGDRRGGGRMMGGRMMGGLGLEISISGNNIASPAAANERPGDS
jgi:hypothetical protein